MPKLLPRIRASMAWAVPMVLFLAHATGAAPAAPSDAPDRLEALGRKNPFRPLIHTDQMPAPPDVPARPLSAPPPRPEPPALELSYLGIAYDGDESVAAVRVGGKVRFVRPGERVAGATLKAISPDKLVWSKNKRQLESPLHRRPGARQP